MILDHIRSNVHCKYIVYIDFLIVQFVHHNDKYDFGNDIYVDVHHPISADRDKSKVEKKN